LHNGLRGRLLGSGCSALPRYGRRSRLASRRHALRTAGLGHRHGFERPKGVVVLGLHRSGAAREADDSAEGGQKSQAAKTIEHSRRLSGGRNPARKHQCTGVTAYLIGKVDAVAPIEREEIL
jgi:hypothetical protein